MQCVDIVDAVEGRPKWACDGLNCCLADQMWNELKMINAPERKCCILALFQFVIELGDFLQETYSYPNYFAIKLEVYRASLNLQAQKTKFLAGIHVIVNQMAAGFCRLFQKIGGNSQLYPFALSSSIERQNKRRLGSKQ